MLRDDRLAFEMFLRNERWGTCVACPTDADGRKLPELCRYTDRYDHRLTLAQLIKRYDLHKPVKPNNYDKM